MRNDERAYLLQRKKSANMMRLQDHKSRLVIPGETGCNCQDSNGAPMTKKKKKNNQILLPLKWKCKVLWRCTVYPRLATFQLWELSLWGIVINSVPFSFSGNLGPEQWTRFLIQTMIFFLALNRPGFLNQQQAGSVVQRSESRVVHFLVLPLSWSRDFSWISCRCLINFIYIYIYV